MRARENRHAAPRAGFALDGVAMTRAELAPIWRDAVGAELFELSIYEEFLRAVQEVNKALPRASRVRLIAGDSAIDWRKIRTVATISTTASLRCPSGWRFWPSGTQVAEAVR